MRIKLDVSLHQVNNLPSPLREEAMEAVRQQLPKEESRISRELSQAAQKIEWLKQQQRELQYWEEVIG